jgi:hypothetical protein
VKDREGLDAAAGGTQILVCPRTREQVPKSAGVRVCSHRSASRRSCASSIRIPPDHGVRAVWAYLEGMDLRRLYGGISAVEPAVLRLARESSWRCGCMP